MIITAYIEKEDATREVELEKNATLKDLLEKLKINPVTVLVARGEDLVLEDETLPEGDSLKIISVISGG